MPRLALLRIAFLPLAITAGALPAAAIEGTYENDMGTTLKVSKRSAGYHAAIDLAWKGGSCIGSVEGPATLKGRVLTLRGRNSATPDACVVRITFKGRAATLDEQSGCLSFHGARCGFRGTVRRAR